MGLCCLRFISSGSGERSSRFSRCDWQIRFAPPRWFHISSSILLGVILPSIALVVGSLSYKRSLQLNGWSTLD